MTPRLKVKNAQLYDAAAWGDVAAIQKLVRDGADVSWRNPDQGEWTPLHAAAYKGHAAAVRALLQAGADVSAMNKWDTTPLHGAAYKGHAAAVRALLQAGADMSAMNKEDWTPLHYAAHNGRVEAVRALLQAGADVGAKDKHGSTPLDVAGTYPRISKECTAHLPAIKEALQVAANQRKPVPAPGPAINTVEATTEATTSTSTTQLPSAPSALTVAGSSLQPTLYTGGAVMLPSPLPAGQVQGMVAALAGAGLQTALQMAGAVATCNPVALVMAPMQLLGVVRTLLQQGQYSRERLQRMVDRVAALEPALKQLGQELQRRARTGTPVHVVQSLCSTLLLLAHVLVRLQELQRKLQSKGEGALRRMLALLKAGGYEQDVAALDCELRDCVNQLSLVLSIAQFTQVAQAMRAREELQVAQWQQQNEADRARDLQQLEGLMVEAVGGVQALQQQLAEQRVVLDGQVVGLQQVAEWLQHMQAGNALIVGHLQRMGQQLDGLGQQMGDVQLDVTAVKAQVAQLVAILMPQRVGQSRPKRMPMDSLPDLALPRERIQVADDLDSALADAKRGAFGGVVQATWEGHQVAIKVYNYAGLGRGNCKEAVQEAVLLCKANHPNIVRCYGVVYDPDTAARDSIQGSLVMEWVDGGSLHEWLQEEEQEELGLLGRVLLAQRVASGMRHLAEKRLVHGDLKPQNILMSSFETPAGNVVPQVKICDFGLAKYTSTSMHSTQKPTKAVYTLPYTSPQRLLTGEPSPQDDAYAFGILLFFIATGSDPFSTIRPDLLPGAVQANTRPSLDQWLAGQAIGGEERGVAEAYCQLAKQCWAAEAGERPSFQAVHGALSDMLARLQA